MQKEWYEICQLKDGMLNGPFGVLQDREAAELAGKAMFGDEAVVRPGNPDDVGRWGVGSKADAKPFATTLVGSQEVELIHGEHPHSRRDNSIYARFPSGHIEGFDGHQLLHEIIIREYNYLKQSSLSGDEVRKACSCTIKINECVVASLGGREVEHVLMRAYQMLPKIHEFSIHLWDPKDREKIVGRKVYYRDHPAVITRFIEDQACVIMQPDPKDRPFPLRASQKEEAGEGCNEMDGYDNSIKEDIYSPFIWWWRK